ncbi:Hypothetical protein R9X50_00052100 [Acrodontium crateriforme]|uniref:Uncharacterized protein n=1 Tax=Acrodontium crateriforme TaxID=150365 RepID=A0AAQ3R232_9PEZI|nr:Hypothetical protein R9X50_00052100 [Acrodontium crateriforme]
MSSRTRLSFDVALNSSGDKLNISISDPSDLQADNLALSTWGSADILANVLHRLDLPIAKQELPPTGAPVIELGAGTGLAGLTAAAVWHTDVVLTDLTPILPNIEANVKLNENQLKAHQGTARCGLLDWANPELLTLCQQEGSPNQAPLLASENKAHVILAADTIYSEEHPELLSKAIRAWLAPGTLSRLVLCYPLRVGYLDHIRDLWEQLEGIGLESVDEGREMVDRDAWDGEDTPYEWCIFRWKS